MRNAESISLDKFEFAFYRAGWDQRESKDKKYVVWIDKDDPKTWTMQPRDMKSPEYKYYQEQNILILLYAFNLKETQDSRVELISQLKSYNYKLINRIVTNDNYSDNIVPYELATALPEKNIDAFRYFYQLKADENKLLPIERFEMNHTEVGSFVIPISISIDDEEASQLPTVANNTNVVLHEYLKAIETLKQIPKNTPTDYAQRVFSERINSKIVKDFFGATNSIAKIKEKYSHKIKEITIGSKGSVVLDYGLKTEEREFKSVDIGGIEVLQQDYIDELEKLEISSDSSKIEEYGAQINVLVDNLNIGGKVIFEVLNIRGMKIDKPFKAIGSQLTKSQLDICADYFKERKPALIIADVTKAKGRMGYLIIESVNPGEMYSTSPQQTSLT